MKSLVQLANEVEVALKPLDDQWFDSQVEWFETRRRAVSEWRSSEEGKLARKGCNWAYYKKLWELAGGKGNYNMNMDEFMKHCEKTIRSRNERIAHKIRNAGDYTTEVVGGELVRTGDGFNGVFKLQTNEGAKTITINTIGAGGYNIQAYHLRTLVKIK